ncbi:hypothetical protein DFJ74DRAFT_765959 [Hyaloraphidium curvatum]|nr:hypothetical protein DFJ74DRAFT_765959 [Hyaloraphidium curvatum]
MRVLRPLLRLPRPRFASTASQPAPVASRAAGWAVAAATLAAGVGLDAARDARRRGAEARRAAEAERADRAVKEVAPAAAEEPAAPAAGGDDDLTVLTNWSHTHSVSLPSASYRLPASLSELELLVRSAAESGTPLRPVGSALSPNGIGFNDRGMVNLALMDSLLSVSEQGEATVQAGARIDHLVSQLRPLGRTLPTFASVREQQVGGFTQAGAHGTGLRIDTVDALVTAVKLVTPGLGTVELREDHPAFYLARCGLGALGIAAEVTLRTVPAHRLVERTFVATREEVRRKHREWVGGHRHARYMWIPHAEEVVVVLSDPEGTPEAEETAKWWEERSKGSGQEHVQDKEAHLAEPYRRIFGKWGLEAPEGLNAVQLRDHLYSLYPLDPARVKEINAASAEFWRRNEGVRTDWSDQVLGFECGGEQWVDECCFRVPELDEGAPAGGEGTTSDVAHALRILDLVEGEDLPAHEPIEQRWTRGTLSPLSPAYAPEGGKAAFSWVGIIMYLPPSSEEGSEGKRGEVTAAFREYARKAYAANGGSGAMTHLAKIEFDPEKVEEVREKMRARMGEENWARLIEWKGRADPKGVLGNEWTERLFRDDRGSG